MSFEKWKKRLAGEKPSMTFLLPDADDEGYYRRPIVEGRLKSGRPNITGWQPVAYWLEDGKLVGTIGDRNMTERDLSSEELWSYCVKYPIPYDVFCEVAFEGKPWPEDRPLRTIPEEKPAETVEDHRAAIRAVVDTITKDLKIDSEDSAAAWLGTRNTLATLRLAADKAGKAIYQPHYAAYKKAFDEWTPMVKGAETAEKRITTAVLQFQEQRRRDAAAAAAAAEQARREEEERNQRIADRAIARGEEPPPPDVLEDGGNLIPPTAPAPIVPTVGTRSVKPELQTFLDKITDEAAVCAFFRGDPELVAVLKTLAQRAIKRGQTVPGITTREGYV